MSALVPNAKAGAVASAPGSEACGCCEGIEAATPQAHANRHGLDAVDYRIGRYDDFRSSLVDGLSSSGFPALSRLLTRDADDFTLGLVDAFACSADVLTFYQERIARESWLRTATERVSLQEMGRLIGYRLRPGIAAETWLAFTLEPPREPPPNAPREPGMFVTGIPAAVTLAAGLKVQSVPGPDEKPQSFETVEAVDARAEWSAMRPWLSRPRLPAQGDRSAWLQGVATGLKPGDALLVVGAEFEANPMSNRWDFRILSEVRPEPEHDRTRVSWKRGLGSLSPAMSPAGNDVRVYALRQRASVFGHNAPMWRTMPQAFRDAYEGKSPKSVLQIAAHTARAAVGQPIFGEAKPALDPDRYAIGFPSWPDFVVSPEGATANGGHVDLDAAYPAIAPGGYAVLAYGAYDAASEPAPGDTYVELYRVDGATEVSRDEFALSGKSSRLRLAGDQYGRFVGRVRPLKVFAQSEELRLAEYPVTTAVTGDEIPVAVAPAGLAKGRRIIVQGVAADGRRIVHRASLTAPARARDGFALLDIAPPLPLALARESVTVAANVALARHGETVAQVLGSGSASEPHQRFELKHAPLTWRSAANELGAASELTVRVGGIEWQQRDTLHGAGPIDHAYTLRSDEAGRDWLQFGDGERGARLPSGSQNVRASYRKGVGIEGNVPAESLTQLMTRPLGLKGAANPGAAEGGTGPEPAAQARSSMPLGTRTLGRVVSLLDYADFARAYAGIAKASSQVLQLAHGNVVAITVAGQDGAVIGESNPVWSNLRDALAANGDPHVGIRLMAHQASTFHVGLRVKCHPDHEAGAVLAAVEATLRDAFSFERRELGQALQQSEVISVAHAVPGVVAIDLDLLYGGTAPHAQTLRSRQVRLLASRMRVAGGLPRPAELLTLHPGPLARLEAMP
ncbi:putative baseplate assembly protein [Luteimonas sp. A611]